MTLPNDFGKLNRCTAISYSYADLCRCQKQGAEAMNRAIARSLFATVLVFGLSACTNPYDPVQRVVGGGLLGAGSGAAIGAAAGGGPGAALGAAIGGAVGVLGGAATTPPPPGYYGYPGSYYGYPVILTVLPATRTAIPARTTGIRAIPTDIPGITDNRRSIAPDRREAMIAIRASPPYMRGCHFG
jgi:hypothetical protein